jgi:hypothetical protein
MNETQIKTPLELAYYAGRHAALAKEKREVNPYIQKLQQSLWDAWDCGFNKGCEERTITGKAKKPKYVRVKCDQCEILVINGIACHEHGCPNGP